MAVSGRLWIELLVTLDVGRQIGRPRLPVPNRRLNAARRLQGRGGVLAYGYARSRQEGRAGGRIREVKRIDGRLINFTGGFESLSPLECDQRAPGTGAWDAVSLAEIKALFLQDYLHLPKLVAVEIHSARSRAAMFRARGHGASGLAVLPRPGSVV